MAMSHLMEILVVTLLTFLPASSDNLEKINVIETDLDVELMQHVVRNADVPIKLRCHDMIKKPGSRMDDIMWQYKKCGPGLSLTDCNELPCDTPWQFALCRNQSKLCTGSTLPISNPTEEDSGIYRCLYKNYMLQQFRVNRVIRVEITDPRSNSIEMLPEEHNVDNQTLIENVTAVFRCRVRSVQWPHIIWVREVDESILEDTAKRTIVFDGIIYQLLNISDIHKGLNKVYTSKLYIRPIQLKDAGYYYCYAMNEKQIESKQVTLSVIPSGVSTVDSPIWMLLCMAATATVLVLCFIAILYNFTRGLISRKTLQTGQTFTEVATSPD